MSACDLCEAHCSHMCMYVLKTNGGSLSLWSWNKLTLLPNGGSKGMMSKCGG